MNREQRRHVTVVIGFAVFVLASVLVAYLARLVPGFEQACISRCAVQHKQGQLVYKGPATSKPTQSFDECECEP